MQKFRRRRKPRNARRLECKKLYRNEEAGRGRESACPLLFPPLRLDEICRLPDEFLELLDFRLAIPPHEREGLSKTFTHCAADGPFKTGLVYRIDARLDGAETFGEPRPFLSRKENRVMLEAYERDEGEFEPETQAFENERVLDRRETASEFFSLVPIDRSFGRVYVVEQTPSRIAVGFGAGGSDCLVRRFQVVRHICPGASGACPADRAERCHVLTLQGENHSPDQRLHPLLVGEFNQHIRLPRHQAITDSLAPRVERGRVVPAVAVPQALRDEGVRRVARVPLVRVNDILQPIADAVQFAEDELALRALGIFAREVKEVEAQRLKVPDVLCEIRKLIEAVAGDGMADRAKQRKDISVLPPNPACFVPEQQRALVFREDEPFLAVRHDDDFAIFTFPLMRDRDRSMRMPMYRCPHRNPPW